MTLLSKESKTKTFGKGEGGGQRRCRGGGDSYGENKEKERTQTTWDLTKPELGSQRDLGEGVDRGGVNGTRPPHPTEVVSVGV